MLLDQFDQALSIEAVSTRIQRLIKSDQRLQDIWVQGEVSNAKQYGASGHFYFTLKGGKATLDCVMWKTNTVRLQSLPRDGDAVLAHGNIDVYPDRGKYQLYADRLRPVGVGDLYAQFERLKAQLEAEGLFDPERKRPLPAFPRVIGIVTSPSAAAFQDVRNVLARRFPLAQVILSPTAVQGNDAPPQIIRALARLNARPEVDVILVCRGGGSIEDLWAFNDEGVARAIATMRVPVISGVGHETDFTIADFVADLRAPTPSAAAELLTPDMAELRGGVEWLGDRLEESFAERVYDLRTQVQMSDRRLLGVAPSGQVRIYRQRLDDWEQRAARVQAGRLRLLRERIEARTAALTAASPAAILARGYALVTDTATGRRLTSVAKTAGQVTIQFQDGHVLATVDKDQNS